MKHILFVSLLALSGTAAAEAPKPKTYFVEVEVQESGEQPLRQYFLVAEHQSAILEVADRGSSTSFGVKVHGTEPDRALLSLKIDRDRKDHKLKVDTTTEVAFNDRQPVATLAPLKVFVRVQPRK